MRNQVQKPSEKGKKREKKLKRRRDERRETNVKKK